MRVLHVTRQFAPSIGGLGDVVFNMARHQRATYGIDARVVTLDSDVARRKVQLPQQADVAGIPVERVRWWGSSRYPIAPSIIAHVQQADLIHVHAIDFFVDFLAITRPFHKRPMLVLTHGGIFHTNRQMRLKQIWFSIVTRISLQAYDAVVASSDNDAKVFSRLRPPHLVTIENGVNVGKLRGGSGPADPHRLLFVGRFAPHKRIDTLFSLIWALRQHQSDWNLVVAGVEEGETKESLVQKACRAGVGNAVQILVGATDETLAREAAAATWFACPSSFEGFGVAAVEAAAAGLVPLLSRIPPFKRLISSLPAGLLYDPEAPADAAAAILALDQEYRERRGKIRDELSESVEAHDWSQVTGRYVALYSHIMEKRSVHHTFGLATPP